MKNETVSVIIPVYNRSEQLRRAIKSVLQQSYPIYEVIVVDDASSEFLNIDELQLADARLRVIRLSQNSGPATARQTGVENTTGNYIAFLDSDDFWFPEKIAQQMKFFTERECESGLEAVVCGWRQLDAVTGSPVLHRMPIQSSGILDFASGCWFCPGSTLLVRRGVFALVGPFEPNLRRLEDYEWFLRFGQLGGRLFITPVVGASISKGYRSKMDDVRAASRFILDHHRSALGPQIRRRMRSWLHVELAAAARNESRRIPAAYNLALSLLLCPRLRIQLNDWWTDEIVAPASIGPCSGGVA